MTEEEVAEEKDVVQGTVDDVQKGCFGTLIFFFMMLGTLFLTFYLLLSLPQIM